MKRFLTVALACVAYMMIGELLSQYGVKLTHFFLIALLVNSITTSMDVEDIKKRL